MNWKRWSRWVVLAALAFLGGLLSAHAGEPAKSDNQLVLPPYVVIDRPITDLWCSIRFRYHLPGAGMKYWEITKAPKWCAARGLSAGDRIVAVDGRPIEGQGMMAYVKKMVAKFGPPPVKPTRYVFDVQPKDGKGMRRVEVIFDESRNITIAYP